MLKKAIIFIFILLNSNLLLLAQCPLGVGITRNPTGFVCKNTPVQFTATPSNGAVNPQYFWVINGDTISSTSTVTTSLNGAHVEVYMTADNCTDTAKNDIYIATTYITADYNVLVTECNQTKADVQINGITSTAGDISPYTYDLNGLGQQTLYTDVPIGTYPLIVTASNGCVDTTIINMTTVQCPDPIPAQAITPNGDGFNDTWTISFINLYPKNEVFIFDRWGQRVYHKKDYTNVDGWDAKYVGTNLPVSTYYYVLKLYLEKSKNKVFKGAVSVFR